MTIADIKRLNHIKYTAFRNYLKSSKSIVSYLFSYLIRVPWHLLHWKKESLETNDILVVVPTINNQKSVRTILEHLPKETCSVWGSDWGDKMPWPKIEALSLYYLPLFIKLYISSSKEDKKLIRDFFYEFITTCAIYKIIEKALIKNNQVKMIVMANDHILLTRCLVELAEKHNIKSLYVQHASVTDKFPPLRFAYSFLDGLESFEKYKLVGNIRGHVFLSGSPRFDAFHNYKVGEKKYQIGIALNELDDEDLALNLCLYLKEHYSANIIVRPHPGMLIPGNLLFHKEKFVEQGFAISDPRKDLSYVFLGNIKVMVANESGIHLDAALMGVPSLLYNFAKNDVLDWYSYIKKGLIKMCDTFEEVKRMLDSGYQLSEDVVRYYAASFKTDMDGKVGEMIAEFIKKDVFESEESALSYVNGFMTDQGEYLEYRN